MTSRTVAPLAARPARWAMAAACVVCLAACGGDDENPDAASSETVPGASASAPPSELGESEPTDGPCALLDATVLADLVLGPVNSSEMGATAQAGEGCIWNREDLEAGAGVISLTYLHDADVMALQGAPSRRTSPDFREIGDGAWNTGGGIVVLVGDVGFRIDVTGNLIDRHSETILDDLARDAVARI